jgi:hypothetical protein
MIETASVVASVAGRRKVREMRVSFLPQPPANQEEKRIKTPSHMLGDDLPVVQPPIHDILLPDEHDIVEVELGQQNGPDFSVENTTQDDMIQGFRQLVTDNAVAGVLQPMMKSPFRGPAPPVQHQPEKESDP